MKDRSFYRQLRKPFLHRLFIILLILAQIFLIIEMVYRYAQLQWLAALLSAFSVFIALHLLTHNENGTFNASMIFLILLFPLFGGIFYLIFHFQTAVVGFRKRLRRIEVEAADAYFLPDRDPEQPSGATADLPAELPESSRLLRYLEQTSGFPACGNTETRYFADGLSFRDALLDACRNAERYIFLEYFILAEGKFHDAVMDVLKERAAAGVDVRVIYDDLGCFLTLPTHYPALLREWGIRCCVFNPFRPFLTTIQNNRDHRKIAVIDGHTAFTGGMNIADEYTGEKIRFGKWKDSSICVRGRAAWSFTVMFLQMWTFLSKEPVDYAAFLPPRQAFRLSANGWVQPYADSPMSRENVGEQVYLQVIGNAKRYVYFTTPYLALDENMISALCLCAKSGVDVRLIAPGVPDKRLVHFTTRSYYNILLNAGVRIYEYDGFMHAKTFLSDDVIATVGTINTDFRSFLLHFECGTCLYRTDSISDLKCDYLATLEQCREISPGDCRKSLISRFLQHVCRVFAPLM